ncbi:MAG TPA: hypothetical protein PKI76_08090 [Oscillospiraceae bacterium]|nr:hypothetical protein [Oscillospiraceae bacterium]
MKSISVEKITIPYERALLYQWKQRNPEIVPNFMLAKKGPGTSNGYGFGEWTAEIYFRKNGYFVFTNDFDLLSKDSKYKRFNKMIETLIIPAKLHAFKEACQEAMQQGYKIENPDLFVFNIEDYFFAEVKKEKDQLRDPQMRFFYLAKEILGIDSKLIYLCDKTSDVITEELIFNFELTE